MSLAAIKQQLGLRLATISGLSSRTLSGTVAKIAASTTITGTNTMFLSELRPGEVISIPGTAVEYFVVTAIASNTSATIHAAAVNNATGQTATLYGVWVDEPDITPTEGQMPCIVTRRLPTTPRGGTNTQVKLWYRFEFLYLLHPWALGQLQESDTAINGYMLAVFTALLGAVTLSGNVTVQDFDGDVASPTVEYRGETYWGVRVPWRVEAYETLNFAA